MKKNGHSQQKQDDFIAPAMRAFRRVAKQLRLESDHQGIPLVVSHGSGSRLRAGSNVTGTKRPAS